MLGTMRNNVLKVSDVLEAWSLYHYCFYLHGLSFFKTFILFLYHHPFRHAHYPTFLLDECVENLYIRTNMLRTIRLKSHDSIWVKLLLLSKSNPQWIKITPEVLYNYFSTKLPLPHLHTGQNILLYSSSVRTFASLTTRDGGSYISDFTVYKECLIKVTSLCYGSVPFHSSKSPFIVIYLYQHDSKCSPYVCLVCILSWCLSFHLSFLCHPNHMSVHQWVRPSICLFFSDCLKILSVFLSISLCTHVSQYESFLLLICLFRMIVFPFWLYFILKVSFVWQ